MGAEDFTRKYCAECGRLFPVDELMLFTGFSICAECKPVAIAKIKRDAVVGSFWRKKRQLIALLPADCCVAFPPRCVACNADVQGEPIERWTFYVETYWLIIVFLTALVALPWLLARGRRIGLKFFLCDLHVQRQRRGRRLAFWLGIAAFVTVFAGGILTLPRQFNSPVLPFVLVVLLFVFLLLAAFLAASWADLRPRLGRVTRSFAIVNHCSRAFLTSVPNWPSS